MTEMANGIAALVENEKAHNRAGNVHAAERRRFSIVKFTRDYVFQGQHGAASFVIPLDGKRQLILHHFSANRVGCIVTGCPVAAEHIPHLARIHTGDTNRVVVSRAPIGKLRLNVSCPRAVCYGCPA